MNSEQEREVLEFLEELANWNIPYLARKSKGQYKRQIRAQQLLADIYFHPKSCNCPICELLYGSTDPATIAREAEIRDILKRNGLESPVASALKSIQPTTGGK